MTKTLEQRIQQLVLDVIVDYRRPQAAVQRVELASRIARRITDAFERAFEARKEGDDG